MDENSIITDVSEADAASFDAEWDESPAPVEAETEGGETEAIEAAENTVGDQHGDDGAENAEPQSTEEPAQEVESTGGDQTFTLKHLGVEKSVGREEVVSLAQKGLDYDRQVSEHNAFLKDVDELGGMEALRDRVDFLKELAEASNTTVEALIDASRASMLSKKEGISMSSAKEKIDLQKQERALSAREAKLSAKEETDAAAEKRRNDIAEFFREYPDVDMKSVPAEVWNAVGRGETLTSAYARHEVKALRAQLSEMEKRAQTAEKNAENRAKTAGSMQSAGNKSNKLDPFDEAWESDD